MQERNETFPSAAEAVFLVVMLFALECLVWAALFDLRSWSGIHQHDTSGVVTLLGNGILFSALLHYKGLSYRSLFHSSPSSGAATLGRLAVPLLLLVPGLIMAVASIESVLVALFPMSSDTQAMFERMNSNGLQSIVSASLLAPVLEEMLFRGIILRSFLRQYRPDYAIAGSAILFGLAHLNIYQFPVAVIAGIVCGWLYERTRSLWPCIFFHAAYNTSTVLLVFLPTDGEGAKGPSALSWIIVTLLAFGGVSMLRRLLPPGKAQA